MKRQEVQTNFSRYEAEVQFALANLNELKEFLGQDANVINSITESDLRKSRAIRTSVCEYKEFYFYLSKTAPKSFEKKYDSEE